MIDRTKARIPARVDAVVVGGGFYGCRLALEMKAQGHSVAVLEREAGLLRRASWANQARVHNGHHYPRHFLTALRSHINFPRFVQDYDPCIERGFVNTYAVARHYSKTTARQFSNFMERVGAPVRPAPEAWRACWANSSSARAFRSRPRSRRRGSSVRQTGCGCTGAGATVPATARSGQER